MGRPRPGFTLLELLLAALIAAMLMTALYMAMSVVIKQTQTVREAGDVEHLTRGIFNKMALDLSGTLAPLPPKSGGNSAASGGGSTPPPASGSGGAAGAGGTTPATGSDGSAAPASGAGADPSAAAGSDPNASATAPGATDSSTAVAADVSFQGGLVGTEKQLTVFAGRTPEALTQFPGQGEQVRADQRQIIYWVGPEGGLYRQERPWVTADGVRNSLEPDTDAQDAILLAEEVSDVTFEYSDGSSWATEWTGTDPGPDGVTPLGPPRAIRVTLTLRIPLGGDRFAEKRVQQVVPVRAAPGTYTVPLVEAPTDGANGAPADATAGSTPGAGTNPTTPGASPGGGQTPSLPPGVSLPPNFRLPPGVSLPPGLSLPPGASLPPGIGGGGAGGRGGGAPGGAGAPGGGGRGGAPGGGMGGAPGGGGRGGGAPGGGGNFGGGAGGGRGGGAPGAGAPGGGNGGGGAAPGGGRGGATGGGR